MPNEQHEKLQKIDVLANRNAIDLLDWQICWIEDHVPPGSVIHSLFRVYKDDFNMEVGIEIVYEYCGMTYQQMGTLH